MALRQKAKVLLYFLPPLLVALFISTTFRRVRGLERELFSTHKRQIRIGLVSIFDNKCGSHTNVVFFRHNLQKDYELKIYVLFFCALRHTDSSGVSTQKSRSANDTKPHMNFHNYSGGHFK